MSDIILLLVGIGVGIGLAHASALKQIRQSIETDFEAIRAHLKELTDKL